MTTRLLAIETAGDLCSVALAVDTEITAAEAAGPRMHARSLLPLIDGLLRAGGVRLAEIDAIAFGRGPGSFTGVRLAAAVAQGLALGAQLPVIPVSTLAALAQAVHCPRVAVAVDARMDQVYWGVFAQDTGDVVPLADECVIDPAVAVLPAGQWCGVGSGFARYWEHFPEALQARVRLDPAVSAAHARHILSLAQILFRAGTILAPEAALPVYLRDNVAKKSVISER